MTSDLSRKPVYCTFLPSERIQIERCGLSYSAGCYQTLLYLYPNTYPRIDLVLRRIGDLLGRMMSPLTSISLLSDIRSAPVHDVIAKSCRTLSS